MVLGAEEDRSETVKRLNDLFYQATEEESVPDDPLADLPLWRVQWNALPGERQVYNVHVPHYTDMFERLVRRPRPWYFGHVLLPGGSANLRAPEFALPDGPNATRVGTVMEVLAVARQDDGRLVVVSQGVGRFRVETATQAVPHWRCGVEWVHDDDADADGAAARWRAFEFGVAGVRLLGGEAAIAELAPLDASLLPEDLQPPENDDGAITALEAKIWRLLADNCELLGRCLVADGADETAVRLPANLLALAPPDVEPSALFAGGQVAPPEPSWPGVRRRQRLAFAVAAALGPSLFEPALGRQALLDCPSATARLGLVADALERRLAMLDAILEAKLGEA